MDRDLPERVRFPFRNNHVVDFSIAEWWLCRNGGAVSGDCGDRCRQEPCETGDDMASISDIVRFCMAWDGLTVRRRQRSTSANKFAAVLHAPRRNIPQRRKHSHVDVGLSLLAPLVDARNQSCQVMHG